LKKKIHDFGRRKKFTILGEEKNSRFWEKIQETDRSNYASHINQMIHPPTLFFWNMLNYIVMMLLFFDILMKDSFVDWYSHMSIIFLYYTLS
jgi:hypothetical protein